MVARQVVSLASKCSNCRQIILNSFISFSSTSVRPGWKPSSTNHPYKRSAPIRSFTTSKFQQSDIAQQQDTQVWKNSDETIQAEYASHGESIPDSASSLPWYLQVETPTRITRSLSERQQLPELPSDSPPLLLPILEHISTDLGLDDLLLFDLRKLDPPPALGANLIMLLGTARSEKHLHVSADRLCRWLRSTHKLTPYADGLLGRGQLKLNMKRKARRARLLSSVGSSERSGQDDGLKTDWICVNVGTIEDGEGATNIHLEPEGFVGFGEQIKGARVVIQMLTQEKREELDLEELWGNTLESQRRRNEKSMHASEGSTANQEVGQASLHPLNLPSNPSSIGCSSDQKLLRSNHQQNRSFHTSMRPCGLDDNNLEINERTSLGSLNDLASLSIASNNKHLGYNNTTIEPSLRVALEPLGTYAPSLVTYAPPLSLKPAMKSKRKKKAPTKQKESPNPTDISETLANKTKHQHLVKNLKSLQSLSQEDAVKALGKDAVDLDSTPFLTSFYQSFPLLPDAEHWQSRLALVCYGIRIGHPGYDKVTMMSIFDEMRASVISVPPDVFLLVFDTLLYRYRNHENTLEVGIAEGIISTYEVSEAIRVLDDMANRSFNVVTEKILLSLYIAAAAARRSNKKELQLNHIANRRLRTWMDKYRYHEVFRLTNNHCDILTAFASADNWAGFWAHWRGNSKHRLRKPLKLYNVMFRLVARSGDQRACMKTLRTWVPEMAAEEPPVKIKGKVAEAIMECLRVAEPEVETEFQQGRSLNSEWYKLWRRCVYSFPTLPQSDRGE